MYRGVDKGAVLEECSLPAQERSGEEAVRLSFLKNLNFLTKKWCVLMDSVALTITFWLQ